MCVPVCVCVCVCVCGWVGGWVGVCPGHSSIKHFCVLTVALLGTPCMHVEECSTVFYSVFAASTEEGCSRLPT